MKILHISAYPPDHFGGVEIFCKNLTQNLQLYNIESDILTTNIHSKKSQIEYLNGIRVVKQRPYIWVWNLNPLTNVLNYIIKNYKNYDLIHAHSYVFLSTIQAILAKKIFKLKIPLILHLHGGVQMTDINPTQTSMKLLLLFKNLIFDKFIGKICLSIPDAVISVSKQDLLSINKVFKVNRINNYYVPNAIDIDLFKPNNNIPKYITFIGQLSYFKGIDIYLEICKKLYQKRKDLQFLVIGDGALKKDVISARKQLPLTYYPKIEHERIPEILNETAVLVLTSRSDGLPTVLLEAASCGVPIVASNVGNIPEIVHHKKNGYLFDFKDTDTAVNSILKIIEQDLFKSFGNYGRNLIKRVFTWKKIIKKIIYIYNTVL